MDRGGRLHRQAHERRANNVLTTPLQHSPALSAQYGLDLYLKCEHIQTTGSFKFRGASNKLRLVKEDGSKGSVIAASSGNHGQAVALAARDAGIEARIFVPAAASPAKMAAIQAYGARLELVEGDSLAAEKHARSVAEQEGKTFVSPYNDFEVIAGQGTIGVELLEQLADFDAVFVSVGGGGLISGIGAAIKSERPNAELVGCWPENSPAMHECLKRGEIVDVAEESTLSDGTAGGIEPGTVTFELCRQYVDRRVLVSEAAIARAMHDVALQERWIVEGAAGVAIAGVAELADKYRGKRVVAVVCGRNITLAKFLAAVG